MKTPFHHSPRNHNSHTYQITSPIMLKITDILFVLP